MRQRGAVGWFKHDVTHRGVTAWLLAALITVFYVLLYRDASPFEPLAAALHLGSKWTLYGLLYTLAVFIGGVHMLRKYGHNRYQVVRTIAVMVVQSTLAFSVPLILKFFQQPEFYFSYLWPLKVEYFYPDQIFNTPLPFVLYSFLGSLILVPILGLFFGKRWYCSWVCGCGGLANTAGEPFRHLTSKSEASWRFERWAIYPTLAACVLTTVLVLLSHSIGRANPGLAHAAMKAREWYGLLVVTFLSGIIGVALYPIGGTRVWCRNFCPMAAVLGLVQKVGRFRIRVKKDMCISCGMCSKYCEMGIDVRAYAQKNETFVRAACVGCGMCAEVCPRGVLSLEQRWPADAASRAGGGGDELVQLRLRK